MTHTNPTRRAVLTSAAALAVTAALPAAAQTGPAIHIVKDPNCGCCTAWAQILHDEGFRVTFEHRENAALTRLKQAAGIPQEMFSCHTAAIEGYLIEGHVPPADIRRLLRDRPTAIGLAVPDHPGSPRPPSCWPPTRRTSRCRAAWRRRATSPARCR